MSKPKIVMFAGPNGSGKSTITSGFQNRVDFPTNYANADEVAKTLPGNPMSQSYAAARIVEQQRLAWVADRQPFAFETVMSHPSKLIQLQQAKTLGYQVEVYYVGTINPQYNVLRVADRVLAGGHDVPTDKVVERYYRSLALLPLAIEIADRITIIDNTEIPRECATGKQGAVQQTANDSPDWVVAAVRAVNSRQLSKLEYQNRAINQEMELLAANAWDGCYQGIIIKIDTHYILQLIDNSWVLHDRLLLTMDCPIGQLMSIVYREGVGQSS
jgi:predicted ABC-type ATPase